MSSLDDIGFGLPGGMEDESKAKPAPQGGGSERVGRRKRIGRCVSTAGICVPDLQGYGLHCRIPKETPIELTGQEKWWVGKDYVNFIFKDFIALDAPFIGKVSKLSSASCHKGQIFQISSIAVVCRECHGTISHR